jgi:outer membrane immunogenic protein
MMKKILLAGVAAVTLMGAGAASAADLPRRSQPAAPMAYAPMFTWTGFYVGVNAGYNWSDSASKVRFSNGGLPLASAGLLPGSFDVGGDGFTGGVQGGYNYQIGQFVVGLEADINYVDSKKSQSYVLPAIGVVGVSTAQGELEYLGTVRGRLGFAYDRALIYATGGLAYGSVKGSSAFSVPALAATWNGAKSDTRTGFAVGGGLEYAFTNNLTGKLEYLYYDLGKKNYTVAASNGAAAGTGAFYNLSQETKGSIVRAGLNYKF